MAPHFLIHWIQQARTALQEPSQVYTHTTSSLHRTVWAFTEGCCDSSCAQFVKNLSEHRLVPVVDLRGDMLSTSVAFNLSSYAGVNVANSDPVHCGEISEKTTSFAHRGTRISFTLILGHIYEIANSASFLIFKTIPQDVVLPHTRIR